MDVSRRVQAFAELGKVLRNLFAAEGAEFLNAAQKEKAEALKQTVSEAKSYNGWFDVPLVKHALTALGESLKKEKLEKWVSAYKIPSENEEKTVGVVMAGNVPAVGFHDFLSVLMSGNRILAKLSSDDSKLMPAIADVLVAIEPKFESKITFTDGTIKDFDAIIATGSNNTARYFEYYFGKYPNIIRKNRNGVAVLTGKESAAELKGLADDIFLYYGLGCRNVSKLFVPKGYNFTALLDVLNQYEGVSENHKYHNNYDYNKAIFLVNKQEHYDSGNVLLTESENIASPVGVLHYEFYESETALRNILMTRQEELQCVVSGAGFVNEKIAFGKSQQPELWEYADGVDTMAFLLQL